MLSDRMKIKVLFLLFILYPFSSHAVFGLFGSSQSSPSGRQCISFLNLGTPETQDSSFLSRIPGRTALASLGTIASQGLQEGADLQNLQRSINEAKGLVESLAVSTYSAGDAAAEYSALTTLAFVKKAPSAAIRTLQFDLSPTAIINEVIVPFMAITREMNNGTWKHSRKREANVLATTVVRNTELGLKVVKVGIFGGLPDPLGITVDLLKLEMDIKISTGNRENLIKETIGALSNHIRRTLMDPGLSMNERAQRLIELEPILDQLAVMIHSRIESYAELSTLEKFLEHLEVQVEAFRLSEFGELN